VVVKAISNECINSSDYQRSTEAFRQKPVHAPLARTESLEDSVAHVRFIPSLFIIYFSFNIYCFVDFLLVV